MGVFERMQCKERFEEEEGAYVLTKIQSVLGRSRKQKIDFLLQPYPDGDLVSKSQIRRPIRECFADGLGPSYSRII